MFKNEIYLFENGAQRKFVMPMEEITEDTTRTYFSRKPITTCTFILGYPHAICISEYIINYSVQ